MRIRSLKPQFFSDGTVCSMPFQHRLVFQGLWCCADRAGILRDKPIDLRLQIMPNDPMDMDAVLNEIADTGLIKRYCVDGQKYIQVVNFTEHQVIRGSEATYPLRFPGPDGNPTETPWKPDGNPEEEPEDFQGSSEETPRKPLGNMGKGKGKGKVPEKNTESSAVSLETTAVSNLAAKQVFDQSPVLLEFPTNGNPRTWELRQAQLEAWAALYPGLDVLAECRAALAWILANNRKTASGMPRFIVSWLTRSNNSTRAVAKAVRRDGAYIEQPGERKANKPFVKYSEVYFQAKADGKSAEEAAAIAKAATVGE